MADRKKKSTIKALTGSKMVRSKDLDMMMDDSWATPEEIEQEMKENGNGVMQSAYMMMDNEMSAEEYQ